MMSRMVGPRPVAGHISSRRLLPDLHVQPDAAVAGSCRLCVASETYAVLRVFAACARCSRRSFVPHSAVRASETFAWLVSMQRARRVAEIFYDALDADGDEIENE